MSESGESAKSVDERIAEDSAQLERLLAHIVKHLAADIRFADKDVYVGAAVLVLLNYAIAQAKIVQSLKGSDHAGAAVANVRVMLEIWTDVHYILAEGDPHFNAVRYLAFGILEFREFAQRSTSITGRLDARLEQLRAAASEAVAAVEASHKPVKGRAAQLWSNTTRRKMLAALGKKFNRERMLPAFHKLLALDGHAVISGALDVAVDESGPEPRIQFYRRHDPLEAWAINAGYSYWLLGEIWNSAVGFLGLE